MAQDMEIKVSQLTSQREKDMDEIDGLRKQLEELKLQNKQKDEELSSARTENSKLQ